MTVTRSLLFATSLILAVFSAASTANAQFRYNRTRRVDRPAQPQQPQQFQTIRQFAQHHGMKTAEHRGKVYIQVQRDKLARNKDAYTAIGDDKLVEFNGAHHLHTRYNGTKDAHFLFGTLNAGGGYTPPFGKCVGVVCRLTDREHAELNAYISAATLNVQDEIGSWNYNGGRPKRYYGGQGAANCTSWIATAKIGDDGKTVSQLFGSSSSYHGVPRSFIKDLARNGNERVEAVLLHEFTGDINNWHEVNAFIDSSMQ